MFGSAAEGRLRATSDVNLLILLSNFNEARAEELRNPLRVAQEIAVADTQTEGRLVIGMGTGYQRYEFDRYNVVLDDRVDVFLEYWDVIEKALVDGEVEYNGKYISLPKTHFAISTQQKPLPPIFVTSSHPKLLERFKKWKAVPFLAASTLGSPVLYKMVDGLNDAWTTIGIGKNGVNYGAYSNPRFDTLLDSALFSSTADARDKFTAAYQVINDDAPAVWLYEPKKVLGIHRRFRISDRTRPDAWWFSLADWYVPPTERILRDRIPLSR